MELLIGNQIDVKKWQKLLSDSQFASPFQTPIFYSLNNSIKGLSAEVFAIEDNNRYLSLAVVVNLKEKGLLQYFSRRSILFGGPLIESSSKGKKGIELLLNRIPAILSRNSIYCEIRNSFDYSDFKYVIEMEGWTYEPYLNVQIYLKGSSMDEILKGMTYNRRREIRLSIKEGVTFFEADNIGIVKILYFLLENLYKKKVRLPLPSFEFFEKLFYSELGKVFVVKHLGNIIGGSFCIYYPGISINTLYYVGLQNYHSKIFPTHLAIFSAIQFAIENKLEHIDLMGAGKPKKKYGVRDYKTQFGGVLVEHGRFIKILNPLLYRMGVLGIKILSKLK